MVKELGKYVVLWLNAFPTKGGLPSITPRELMTGVQLDYNQHCKLAFGTYVQTHEERHARNGPEARTIGAITLGPNMSSQSGYWFMSLSTGKRIHRRRWTKLPMPREVIDRIEHLGRLDSQPPLITFCDRHGAPETNDDKEEERKDMDRENNTQEQTPCLKSLEDSEITGVHEMSGDDLNDGDNVNRETTEVGNKDQTEMEIERETTNESHIHDNEEPLLSDTEDQPLRRSTRDKKQIDKLIPSFTGQTYAQIDHPELPPEAVYACMAQLSLKNGLKHFKEDGVQAIKKELGQLHLRDTFEPLDPKNMSKEQREQTLESHLFLEEKRDKSVKGRMVADGSKQRAYTDKNTVISPTCATESLLLTATIDANEGRDVAMLDIPNDFI